MAEAVPMMNAAVYQAHGASNEPGFVNVGPMARPTPNEDQVLIKVYAASLNPFDYKIAFGFPGLPEIPFPKAYGYDYAGKIVEVGANVNAEEYPIGMAVHGMVSPYQSAGSVAEYTVVETNRVEPKPDNLSFVEAAGAPCVSATSFQALTRHSTIKAGETNVLILGGSSSTGMMGIQYAKSLGAALVATTSTQEELCSGLGADVVVNYREADFVQVFGESDTKFDIVYDCVGAADTFEKCSQVMNPGSKLLSIAGVGWSQPEDVPFEYVGFYCDQPNSMGELREMFENGSIKVILDERSPYTLDQVPQLLADLMGHTAHGKLVVKMADDD